MIDLPPQLLDGFSTVALVVLVGWLVFTGRLIPRRTYDDKVHECTEWRAESRIKDAQIAEKDEQLRHMAEVGKTVDSIMSAMQRNRES